MKTKILFVIDILRGGGAEKVLVDTVKHLDKDKFEITVLSVFDGGKYVDAIKKYANYKYIFPQYNQKNIVERILSSIKYRIAKFRLRNMNPTSLYKTVIDEKYDYEVSFLEGYSASIVSGSTNKESYKIAWIHTDLIKNPWSKKYYKYKSEKDIYMSFNKIICVSKSVKESFVKKFDIYKNIEVIYNPIPNEEIMKKSLEVVDDLSISSKFKLVVVGRLAYEKGFDRILKIHKKLIEENIDNELWIIGEGNQEQDIRRYIEENNLNNSVKMIGFKDNPYKYMKKCDLFICPSRAEGFSLVIAEAMILGLPIISTNCSGPNELLDFGKYGILVDNDEEMMYKAIKKMIYNEHYREIYAIKSKNRAENFKLEKSIREIESVFSKKKVI